MDNKSPAIQVIDIFDELKEENNRLEKELMFANKSVIILSKFKLVLDVICVELEPQIESKHKKELINLRKEYKKVLEEKKNNTNNNNKKFIKTIENLNKNVMINEKQNKTLTTNANKKALIVKENLVSLKSGVFISPEIDLETGETVEYQCERVGNSVKYLCDWIGCDFKTNTKTRLMAHKNYHNGDLSSVSHLRDDISSQMEYQNNEELNENSNNSFSTNSKDDKNEKRVKRYSCDWIGCEYRCDSLNILKSHKNYHTGDRPEKCPVLGCGKAFAGRKQLRTHVRLVHTMTEKIFVCDAIGCNKRFKNNIILTAHMKTHSQVKPFVCEYPDCGYRSASKPYLDYHQQKHMSSEDKYKCNFEGCNKSYKFKNSFRRHLMVHQNFQTKCHVCHLQFKNVLILLRHQKYDHSNEEMACEWPDCQFKTNNLPKFRKHMNVVHCVRFQIRPNTQQ